jgi:phosphate transport system substrate-binding protein
MPFTTLSRLLMGILLLIPVNGLGQTVLTGSGATFPSPLYRQWIETFKTASGVRIRYEETGSSTGIRMLREKKVDFGATDAFLSDTEVKQFEGKVLHIPTCLGAVSLIYNLPEGPPLRLSGETLAAIFSGDITTWSDRRIAADNPGTHLPHLPLTVAHRSDGSGTTFVFSDFLSKVSRPWQQRFGRGKTIDWAAGLGADGNPGVARLVARVPGSIGYVSLNYARKRRLPAAAIQNRSGRYVIPSPASVSRAAAVPLPDDTRLLITDTIAVDGYPISTFTYLIFYQEQQYDNRPAEKAEALQRFLKWVISEGQSLPERMHYAPLPPEAFEKAGVIIDSMRFGSRPLAVSR